MNLRRATEWAVLAVFGYALQHVLQKPLATTFGQGWTGVTRTLALSESILFVGMAITMTRARPRHMLFEMLQPDKRWLVAGLSGLNAAAGLMYIYNISQLRPEYVASVSNIFPLWLVLWWMLKPFWSKKAKAERSNESTALALAAALAASAVMLLSHVEVRPGSWLENRFSATLRFLLCQYSSLRGRSVWPNCSKTTSRP